MLNWTPWALPGLAVLFGGLALAWFIYRARPDRTQNRLLALQLVCEALAVGLIGGATWVLDDAGLVTALGLTSLFIVWPKLWTYYSFLATLDTPLARPLRTRGVLPGLLAATLILATTVLVRPEWYGGQAQLWPAIGALHMTPGTLFLPIFWLWALMWIVGLTFSISALRQARTPILREQARAYLVAFGFRDVGFVLLAVAFTVMPPTWEYYHWLYIVFPLVWLVYYPLVAWGILKHQLFDIELQLKRGLQGTVVAGAIAAAFFVVAYAIEQFVSVSSFVPGLVTAGLLAVTIQPLQRKAERLADRLMPGVEASQAYLTERKHEVYRGAIEAAMQDGSVSDRERAILVGLQSSLEVSAAHALRIEREVESALTAPA